MYIWKWLRDRGAKASAGLCVICMLCILPLAYRNAFFDINRFKVQMVYVFGAIFTGVGLMLLANRRASLRVGFLTGSGMPIISLMLFGLGCVITCGRHAFPKTMLTGSEGRYCGLYFLLCCLVMFMVVVRGKLNGKQMVCCVCGAASICAWLGIVNACGLDPLQFYGRMQENQKTLFLSTIGNIDFFGAYMAMIAPVAIASFSLSDSRESIFWGSCSLLLLLGVSASRSDTAYFAVQLAFCALFVLSASSYRTMMRTLAFWSFSWFSLPLLQRLMLVGRWELAYEGVLGMLCRSGLAFLLGLAFLGGMILCFLLQRKGGVPKEKRVRITVRIVICGGLLLLVGLIWLFTCVFPEIDLAGAETLLRYGDEWGTRRGFVWRCAFQALSDYEPIEWIFGKGIDHARSILSPYFDRKDMLAYGVFNDAHNQLIQFLLTGGLWAALSMLGFHCLTIHALGKRAEKEPLLIGIRASMIGYSLIAMLSVTQPILVATYLMLSALGLSHCAYLEAKEELHES